MTKIVLRIVGEYGPKSTGENKIGSQVKVVDPNASSATWNKLSCIKADN